MSPIIVGALCIAAPPFVVVIDPGHDPAEPGALGTSGTAELIYNDRLAERVVAQLDDASGLRVLLSRAPGELLPLVERARAISARHPDLVVSLHHDSVKPRDLSWRLERGILLPQCMAQRGYSLFAQARGPHRHASRRIATAIAERYRALGLRHTIYHARPPENRRLLDPERGIYAGDFLYLLRTIDAPVVLIESGFVVNPGDEARLSDTRHRDALAVAIADAVRDFAGSSLMALAAQ